VKPSESTRRLVERLAFDRAMVGRMLVRFYGFSRRDVAAIASERRPAVKASKGEGAL